MREDDFIIREFEQDDLDQVIELLHLLWGKSHKERHEYFTWKYINNPSADKTLGVVAIHKNKVVGFRGYMASEWTVRSQQLNLRILAPGDACVSLDHRRKGLSVKMGYWAMQAFSSNYSCFLNITSSADSLPGNLNMGFYPLTKRFFLTAYNLVDLFHYLGTHKKKYDYGNFKGSNKILVSDHVRPDCMAEIVVSMKGNEEKAQLLRDKKFYQWRYKNPQGRYKFVYFGSTANISAFVVLKIAERSRRVFILDYGFKEPFELQEILDHVLKSKSFDLVSIFHFSVDDSLFFIFKQLGFKNGGLFRYIESLKSEAIPVLVRPVKSNIQDQDWQIGKLDTRVIENWFIPAIASDGL